MNFRKLGIIDPGQAGSVVREGQDGRHVRQICIAFNHRKLARCLQHRTTVFGQCIGCLFAVGGEAFQGFVMCRLTIACVVMNQFLQVGLCSTLCPNKLFENRYTCRHVCAIMPQIMIDWSDLRFVLETVRQGGLSGAARILGVNHATVSRRISSAEAAAGALLFDRLPGGYRPTEAGLEAPALLRPWKRRVRPCALPLARVTRP